MTRSADTGYPEPHFLQIKKGGDEYQLNTNENNASFFMFINVINLFFFLFFVVDAGISLVDGFENPNRPILNVVIYISV